MTFSAFELWVFDSPPTPHADHEAFNPTTHDLSHLVGVFPLDERQFEANAYEDLVNTAPEFNRPFSTKDRTANLYGIVVTKEAYTPSENEVFQLALGVVADRV